MTTATDLHYDPYDREIDADPYPVYRRLREEAPLYYNEPHDFYAVSRFEDVQRGLVEWKTYSSARGAVLEFIKADIEMPPGVFIFEDPPQHDMHRGLLSRVFTPKKMNALESKVREFCKRTLDPLVGSGRFDFVADLGAQMPMRTIGMLLGIPESFQEEARDRADASLRTDPGGQMDVAADNIGQPDFFADFIDWRETHPSDDLMTELLFAEFEDETGTTRRLTRDEVVLFLSVLSAAGNETTNRLIGWMGKVLAEHPEQRRELVEDRSLIPNTIEELLRFEPPTPHVARYVTRDTELHGQTVPAGSAMICLSGSANRDERQYPDPDRFDIHRDDRPAPHLRLRHPLLPRRRAGSARRASRPRRGPHALPRVGRRLGERPTCAHVDGPGLGFDAGGHRLRCEAHRVIQWATGNTGQRALREVIRHPSLDLVGVRVYDAAKDGVDAGELCGEDPTGVAATIDRDAVLKIEADCCIYMPRATGRGQTRAGLTEDELVEDMVALLGSGKNVVTTCSDLFARGVRLSDGNRARVRRGL